MREGLLAILSEAPRHGYQLKTAFEGATGRVWPLNVGQVYTTLERLERDGLVREVDGGANRVYALTDEGRAELGTWWDAVPGDEPPPRDEMLVKVLVAAQLDPDLALEVVTSQRRAVMGLLQARQRAGAGATSLASRLVMDALVVRAEADLRWLDLCEERLLAEARDRSLGDGEAGPTRTRRRRGGKR